MTNQKLPKQPFYSSLNKNTQQFLDKRANELRFSLQDCRQVCEIAIDLQMWGGESVLDVWPDEGDLGGSGKNRKRKVMTDLRSVWVKLRAQHNHYPKDTEAPQISAAATPIAAVKESLGLGRCPVASPRTLCCNLQTLDAVDNCGYGCSYCSIQSFFDGKDISFDLGFIDKLQNLKLDPEKIYHIGTGQSSDSLMWGNSHGVLDALIDFARNHPNVILELKTKSANVNHFIRANAPKNILCTWSLNTPTLIRHEEHGTVALRKRLAAARKVADAGYVVGFHFHPIIHYDNWQQDYQVVIEDLTQQFEPDEVALVSMGTLTYIKSVMREIRTQAISGQILKMPLVDADGKMSYPDDIKLSLFKSVYGCFPQSWKENVFYYLCMENQRFWKPVFRFEYSSNQEFEEAMKSAYSSKILSRTG